VVNSGIDGSDYASHLVDLARALNQQPRTWVPAPAIARPSSLHRRVSAMLNTHLNRRPIPRSLRIAVAIVLVAATAAIAAAQAPFATVSGLVADSKGGFIPAATLTLSHAATQVKHEVKTDATGHFKLVGLSAGDYTLETTVMGFAPSRDTFSLSAGQLMSRNTVLQVGTLQETITVIDSDTPPVASSRRALAPVKAACTAAGNGAGGNIKPPTKVVDVKPKYPLNLRQAKASGRVEMEATIGPDGTVTSVNVVASPEPDMSAAAAEAVRQWQFTPTLLNCGPVEVNMNVLVSFQGQP
jgi:TonB family protein